MGACSSCLGRREQETYDENEESQPLYADGNGIQYGSFGDASMNGDETADAQRESDALQRVIAKTSSNMVDVYDIAPKDPASRASSGSFGFAHEAQSARYQHLVAKLGPEGGEQAAGVRIDWMGDNDNAENSNERPMSLKTLDGDDDALVGTFADAAAAMK